MKRLLDNNLKWVSQLKKSDPNFFDRLSKAQNPKYLWIGCSDSRVNPNQIVGLPPGELFVHRNIANLVIHSDLNSLSVIQYAVDVLKVKHIIVCGHYGCGGVKAALENISFGFIDNWLQHIRDVWDKHEIFLSKLEDKASQFDTLCELNVIEQVRNTCNTTIIRDAWKREQKLTIYGWIYQLSSGIIKDLGICVSNAREVNVKYSKAIDNIKKRSTVSCLE